MTHAFVSRRYTERAEYLNTDVASVSVQIPLNGRELAVRFVRDPNRQGRRFRMYSRVGKVRLWESCSPMHKVYRSWVIAELCGHLYTYARLYAHAIATYCAHPRPMICFSRQVRHLTSPSPLSNKEHHFPHPKACSVIVSGSHPR